MSKKYFDDIKIGKCIEKKLTPLSFKHYDPEEVVYEGKKMKEILRFALAYWHTWKGTGRDIFGEETIKREWEDEKKTPLENALKVAEVNFEFCKKLGIEYYCFHDRDVSPEGKTIEETNKNLDVVVNKLKELQEKTGVKLLWCTSNLFSNKRYMNGASTNPSVFQFAYAASQVKKCLEVGKKLGAENFVFWGGREGYQTLLNTDLKGELDHFAEFLRMAVEYKKKIGFTGQFLIEPKPREPTKHQYDFDASTVIGFLKTYGLDKDFKLNIEANHATLAARTFEHEIKVSQIYGFLGSIDANQGDQQCGWDTDNFSSDVSVTTNVMLTVLENGGLGSGGLNFDAKLRRESTDVEDLFIAHILGMDTWALGLRNAIKIRKDGILKKMVDERYSTFKTTDIGKKIENKSTNFEELDAFIKKNEDKIKLISGKQEKFQSIYNSYIYK